MTSGKKSKICCQVAKVTSGEQQKTIVYLCKRSSEQHDETNTTLLRPGLPSTPGRLKAENPNPATVSRPRRQPIGVSTYEPGQTLPEEIQQSLPSVEQLQLEMESVVVELLGPKEAEGEGERNVKRP